MSTNWPQSRGAAGSGPATPVPNPAEASEHPGVAATNWQRGPRMLTFRLTMAVLLPAIAIVTTTNVSPTPKTIDLWLWLAALSGLFAPYLASLLVSALVVALIVVAGLDPLIGTPAVLVILALIGLRIVALLRQRKATEQLPQQAALTDPEATFAASNPRFTTAPRLVRWALLFVAVGVILAPGLPTNKYPVEAAMVIIAALAALEFVVASEIRHPQEQRLLRTGGPRLVLDAEGWGRQTVLFLPGEQRPIGVVAAPAALNMRYFKVRPDGPDPEAVWRGAKDGMSKLDFPARTRVEVTGRLVDQIPFVLREHPGPFAPTGEIWLAVFRSGYVGKRKPFQVPLDASDLAGNKILRSDGFDLRSDQGRHELARSLVQAVGGPATDHDVQDAFKPAPDQAPVEYDYASLPPLFPRQLRSIEARIWLVLALLGSAILVSLSLSWAQELPVVLPLVLVLVGLLMTWVLAMVFNAKVSREPGGLRVQTLTKRHLLGSREIVAVIPDRQSKRVAVVLADRQAPADPDRFRVHWVGLKDIWGHTLGNGRSDFATLGQIMNQLTVWVAGLEPGQPSRTTKQPSIGFVASTVLLWLALLGIFVAVSTPLLG